MLLYGFGTDYAKALGLPEPNLTLRALPLVQGYLGLLAILIVATGIVLLLAERRFGFHRFV